MLEFVRGSPETIAKMYTAVKKKGLTGKGSTSPVVPSRKPMKVYRRSGNRKDSTSSLGNVIVTIVTGCKVMG